MQNNPSQLNFNIPPCNQKAKKKVIPSGVEPVAKTLRGLEISLRTNSLRFIFAYLKIGEKKNYYSLTRSSFLLTPAFHSVCVSFFFCFFFSPMLFQKQSWVKEFINYKIPFDPKKDKKEEASKYNGGLDILMDYFVNIDDEGR